MPTDKEKLKWAHREAEILRKMVEHHKKDWIMFQFFKGSQKRPWCYLWGGVKIGIDAKHSKYWWRFHWHTWRRLAFGFRPFTRWHSLAFDVGPLAIVIRRSSRRREETGGSI